MTGLFTLYHKFCTYVASGTIHFVLIVRPTVTTAECLSVRWVHLETTVVGPDAGCIPSAWFAKMVNRGEAK